MKTPLLLVTLLLSLAEASQAATPPTLSPVEQRLLQLEAEQKAAAAVEAAKWRTFPKPKPPIPGVSPHQTAYEWMQETYLAGPGGPERCSYFWPGWKLDLASGIRSTKMRCRRSFHTEVGVNCRTLQLSTRDGLTRSYAARNPQAPEWFHWRLPNNLGEREMVVALCDNVKEGSS